MAKFCHLHGNTDEPCPECYAALEARLRDLSETVARLEEIVRKRRPPAPDACPVSWWPTGVMHKVCCALPVGHDGLHQSEEGFALKSRVGTEDAMTQR